MTIIYCRPIVKLPEAMFINYTVSFTFMAMTETELVKTFTNINSSNAFYHTVFRFSIGEKKRLVNKFT